MAKSVLITGANRGIGQQVARVLAKDGWDVLVGARDKAKGNSAAARLREETGGRLKGVELDVTSDASVTTAAQKLPSAYRDVLATVGGPLWPRVIRLAVERLGGEADLQEIYREIEGSRPTNTPFWREQIRKVIRTPASGCAPVGRGRYALAPAVNDAAGALAA